MTTSSALDACRQDRSNVRQTRPAISRMAVAGAVPVMRSNSTIL